MSNFDFAPDKAELVAKLLEATLNGFSLLMFGGTIWALVFQRSADRVNRKMIATACALLLFSIMHFVIDIIRTVEGLVLYRDTYSGGPIGYFSEVSQWTFVYKAYVLTAQTLVGDAVVLYRCYLAWQSKLVLILPAMLWFAVGVTGIACPYTASREKHSRVLGLTLSKWITSFYVSTFTTNLLATILLVYRIWSVNRKVTGLPGYRKAPLQPMLHVIIDAGMIYSFTLLAALICFATGSNGQYVTLDMITPIISITFYMVFIRAGVTNWTNGSMDIHTSACVATCNNADADEGNRIQIHVERFTEYKVDHLQCTPAAGRNHGSNGLSSNRGYAAYAAPWTV